MIKRVIGTLIALAILATVVVTVLHRDRYRTMLPARDAVEARSGEQVPQSGTASSDPGEALLSGEHSSVPGPQSDPAAQSVPTDLSPVADSVAGISGGAAATPAADSTASGRE